MSKSLFNSGCMTLLTATESLQLHPFDCDKTIFLKGPSCLVPTVQRKQKIGIKIWGFFAVYTTYKNSFTSLVYLYVYSFFVKNNLIGYSKVSKHSLNLEVWCTKIEQKLNNLQKALKIEEKSLFFSIFMKMLSNVSFISMAIKKVFLSATIFKVFKASIILKGF